MTSLVRHLLTFTVICVLPKVRSNTPVTIKMGILLSGNGWKTGNDSYPAVPVAIKDLEEKSKTWDTRKYLRSLGRSTHLKQRIYLLHLLVFLKVLL